MLGEFTIVFINCMLFRVLLLFGCFLFWWNVDIGKEQNHNPVYAVLVCLFKTVED